MTTSPSTSTSPSASPSTSAGPPLPLSGVLVVDASRMLPGATLARQLLDLGADLIKVEDPRLGDPMRLMPPMVDGMGVGFAAHYRGARSMGLDLRAPEGLSTLRRLLARADVFVESFRPGTLSRWGLDLDALRRDRPGLVTCSLPGVPGHLPAEVGHDLNYVGALGVLDHLKTPPGLAPSIQLADVTAGLLATSSILAALLRVARGGPGGHVEQPLATAPMAFAHWSMTEHAAAGTGTGAQVLAGALPCYRVYPCAEGTWLSVGCLEPKFWRGLCEALDLSAHASAGLDVARLGQAAATAVTEALAAATAGSWVARLDPTRLPVAEVHPRDHEAARQVAARLGCWAPLPTAGERGCDAATALLAPGVARAPGTPAPSLGAHGDDILRWLDAPSRPS